MSQTRWFNKNRNKSKGVYDIPCCHSIIVKRIPWPPSTRLLTCPLCGQRWPEDVASSHSLLQMLLLMLLLQARHKTWGSTTPVKLLRGRRRVGASCTWLSANQLSGFLDTARQPDRHADAVAVQTTAPIHYSPPTRTLSCCNVCTPVYLKPLYSWIVSDIWMRVILCKSPPYWLTFWTALMAKQDSDGAE